jgi:hypothetical protein
MQHKETCFHVLSATDRQFSWPVAGNLRISEYRCRCGAISYIKEPKEVNLTSVAVDRELIETTNQLNKISTVLYSLHSEVCKAREDRETFIAGIRRRTCAQTLTNQSNV